MIPASDTYKSISSPAEGIYKELGSKFLSFAFPVGTEEQAKEKIASIKKEYFDARHHCYAYRIVMTGEPWRINDDGEPSSAAGRPILGQILSNELSDILIVVVRYFGGIKLGVPGLIRAYKAAALDAITNAAVVEKVAKEEFTLNFSYLQMNDVMKVLKDMDIAPSGQDFSLECSLSVKVRLSQVEDFKSRLDFCRISG